MHYAGKMIIACPACSTRYAVPDTAIGIDGRTVRCAKCRHSWFQESSSPLDLTAEASVMPVEVAAPEVRKTTPRAQAPSMAAAADEPPLGHEAPRAPRVYEDEYDDRPRDNRPSSFAYEPPFRPRRNPARLWMAGAAVFALATLGAIAAVAHYGLPAWVPMKHELFATDRPDLKLDFPQNRMERRRLPNGTDFFNIAGTITNVGQQRRTVPTLLIVLRDKYNRIVFTVEAAPPRTVLAPGESETVNQAIIDAPASAQKGYVGWKPE